MGAKIEDCRARGVLDAVATQLFSEGRASYEVTWANRRLRRVSCVEEASEARRHDHQGPLEGCILRGQDPKR